MEPINNANAMDYTMAMPQNQQYAMEDYATAPMVYDEEIETKKKSAAGMLGMTALGVLGAAGVIYGIKQRGNIKKLENSIADLTTKNEELTKKLDDAAEKLNKPNKKSRWTRFKNWVLRRKDTKEPEKVAEDAKKATEAEGTKKD